MPEDYRVGWEEAYSLQGDSGLWGDMAIPCIELAISAIREHGYSSVLDIGCGDGRNVERLVNEGFSCVGTDISTGALKHAGNRMCGRALFVVDDAMKLTAFPDSSVYAMTCFDLFGQIPNPGKLLQAFRRVLNPDGIMIANIYSIADSEYGRGETIGKHIFRYHNTWFRFYEEDEVRQVFADWHMVALEHAAWEDPPHGDYRPYRHQHDSWVVTATPPR